MKKLLPIIQIIILLSSCNGKTNSSVNSSILNSVSSDNNSFNSTNNSNLLTSLEDSSISDIISSSTISSIDSSNSSVSSISSSSHDRIASSLGVIKGEPYNGYQILVYAFNDSDNDGYGDLNGVIQKLDYIKEIGYNLIWLSPVMPSYRYHGYDTINFYGIDPRIGTLDDFYNLLDIAHSKDIRIILDIALNHTSIRHPWFANVCTTGSGEKVNWYRPKDNSITYNTGGNGQFYTCSENSKLTWFSSFSANMADLNYDNHEVKIEIKNVIKYWLEAGIDGFRYDAIKHIYDYNELKAGSTFDSLNKNFWNELYQLVKSINPKAFVVGENVDNSAGLEKFATYFDSEFDFPGYSNISDGIKNGGVGSENNWSWGTSLQNSHNKLLEYNENWIPTPITGNHDRTRFASTLGSGDVNLIKKLKLWYAAISLRPGMPFTFAGDEIGMFGTNYGDDRSDKELRLPMKWDNNYNNINPDLYLDNLDYTFVNKVTSASEQLIKSDSLLNEYKALNEFRINHEVIYDGKIEAKLTKPDTAGYKLSKNNKAVYVIINFRNQEVTGYTIDSNHGIPKNIIYGSGSINANNTIKVSALSYVVVEL